MGVPPRLPNSEHRDFKTEIADMLEMETMISGYSIPTLYSPPLPGKRKREEYEKEKRDIFDHRVPTMVERKEEVNNELPPLPFSSMMRRMAAKYQRPASPLPSHLNLPLLSSPLHISSHPYSRLIATLASSYSSTPPPSIPRTTPPPKKMKREEEEKPIDLSPTAAESDALLDVVSVDEDQKQENNKKMEEKEEEERMERALKLQRLIAAAMFQTSQR